MKVENHEEVKRAFYKLFPSADIKVSDDYKKYFHVIVEPDYFEYIGLTYDILTGIAEIFNTTKFEIETDKNTYSEAISDVTFNEVTEYTYTFSVKYSDINSGIPGKTNE